ncbi:hypothetical protein PENSPDRAFT_694865 [Peniophora sp. CONT]|nr:hypothetical protein PENSPDRAFT_694865 [Peniophora sp. CONT]
MRDLTLGATSLVESWVSSTLCGVNFVLYILCLHALLKRSDQSVGGRWLIVTVSTIQILICTSQSVVLLARNMYAFVSLNGGEGAAEYFADQAAALHVADQCLYTVNDWIGSGILLWRAWAINGRNWKLCSPLFVLWILLFVTMVSALDHLGRLRPGIAIFDPSLAGWILAFTLISLTLQVGATALIAWRIFSSVSWTNRQWWTREWHALRIVVESGAMYGILTVLSLVFFLLRVNFGAINIGVLVQISATAPFLMIVRAQAHRRKERKEHDLKLDRERWTQSGIDFTKPTAHASSLSSVVPPDSARSRWTIEVQLETGENTLSTQDDDYKLDPTKSGRTHSYWSPNP